MTFKCMSNLVIVINCCSTNNILKKWLLYNNLLINSSKIMLFNIFLSDFNFSKYYI